MAFSKYFDFTDASLRGDPRWAQAAKWTGYAAPLVLLIVVLSIVQIVLGVLVIVDKDNNLTFGGVIQPLIVPGLSFFNALPSAHLHILARSNIPRMAVWFSTPLCVIYLVSAVVFLASDCFGHWFVPAHDNTAMRKNECPTAHAKGTWLTLVVLQLLSAVCYGVHAAIAMKVFMYHKKRERAIEQGTLVEEVDLEAKERREREARERWQRIVDL